MSVEKEIRKSLIEYEVNAHLVFEVNGRIEVRNLRVDALAHHLPLARVYELAHLQDNGWRACVSLLEASASCVIFELASRD